MSVRRIENNIYSANIYYIKSKEIIYSENDKEKIIIFFCKKVQMKIYVNYMYGKL